MQPQGATFAAEPTAMETASRHAAEKLRLSKLAIQKRAAALSHAQRADARKAVLLLEILAQLDDQGKKLYPNDQARDAALINVLTHDEDYLNALSMQHSDEVAARELEAEAEYHRDMLGLYRTAMECEVAR